MFHNIPAACGLKFVEPVEVEPDEIEEVALAEGADDIVDEDFVEPE